MYAYPSRRPPLRDTIAEVLALRPSGRLSFEAARRAAQGDGSAVVLLPPFLHTDAKLRRFRDHLSLLGYAALPLGIGLNRGPGLHYLDQLARQVRRLADTNGPLRLVGFGAGGLAARWVAQARSSAIRQVVTINAPFTAPLDSALVRVRDFGWLWPEADLGALAVVASLPPTMPWASLYSRSGLIAWQACVDSRFPSRCAPIRGRHRTTPFKASTLAAVAHCLADPEGLPPQD